MLNFTRQLSVAGIVNYALWCARGRKDSAVLSLRSGTRLAVDRQDYGVAYEMFVHAYYEQKRPIDKADVRLIVDLGANVGFSCLYWLQEYPQAHIIAVEPHPRHVERIRANLALNGAADRVSLHSCAAGAAPGRLPLTDLGMSSSLVPGQSGAKSFDVDVVDIYPELLGKRINILKIDIEGGEYDIMADPRFARLDVGALVMEWHQCSTGRDDRAWCLARLAETGFEVEEIFARPEYGMLWAFKSPVAGKRQGERLH